jgi:hypothetical protein
MSNSSSIRDWKNKIIADLHNDEHFLDALRTTELEREALTYSRIFPYYYIPDTITTVTTYILIEIDIKSTSRNNAYAYPIITFTVLCHQDDMRLKMAGVSATRADYLAELIDNKYNGADGFGLGRLELRSNIAGSLNEKFRYRQIVFQGKDFNDSLC